MSDQTKRIPPEPLPAQPRVPGEPMPDEPELTLRALASAMRKVLPPELLKEVIAHLDPLTPFMQFLQTFTEAAAARPPASPAWQPIETAPKDQRELLLLYRPDLPTRERVAVRRPEDWCGEKCCPSAKPTHWMPLPAAPPETNQP